MLLESSLDNDVDNSVEKNVKKWEKVENYFYFCGTLIS